MNRSGFQIGSIFGIKIRINWSWLIIFGLVTWNLTAAFGQIHQDWNLTTRLGVAFAAALLFFSSVLAHEIAHSLVARAKGIPVEEITLFLFGGSSNIQRYPPSPKAELLMAIVGPLTSLILGIVFTLLSGVSIGSLGTSASNPAEIATQLGPVTTLLLWLGPVNLMLAVFNMIPGFPLDGGRVLRAIFWAITDNLKRATRWASWVGQAIAWILIINGIAMVFGVEVPFFGTGIANGLWLAFIGWFLNNAALQSYQQIVIQDVLKGVAVHRMMRSDPPTAKRGLSVNELIHDYIMKTDDHAFPVVEGEYRLVGVVTLEDVRAVPQNQWESKTIDEIMTPGEELVCVNPDDDASEAFDKLSRRDVRQLPVIENGKLVGVLRRSDVVKWLQFQPESEIEQEPTFA